MTIHAVRDADGSVGLAPWDPASSIPTLIGSLLSLCATSAVIFLWIFAGGKKRHDFRYALILNLTVAEFLNSLNNSVSGIAAVVRRRPLSPSIACEVNGWAGQFSVQAVDFSILAITVVTLLTIQLRSFVIYASTTTKTLICLSIWVIPLCTSVFAWSKKYYGPVSGNWCWIEKQFLRQRYTLNHGWRIAIFFITLCTYVFVFIYMSRRLKPQNLSNLSSTIPDDIESQKYNKIDAVRDNAVLAGCGATPRISMDEGRPSNASALRDAKDYHRRSSISAPPSLHLNTTIRPLSTPSINLIAASPGDNSPTYPAGSFALVDLKEPRQSVTLTISSESSFPPPPKLQRPKQSRVDREIWKMLLLNMYPVTYLILWVPGMANRFAEAMGYDVRALVIMQSSTQYIGLVNACVYFYKEHWRYMKNNK